MKTTTGFLFSKTVGKFFCFLGLYISLIVNSQAAGFVDVSALSISELPVTIGQNFNINFWLKEYHHDSKSFEYVEVWIQDKNKKDIYPVKRWDNVSFLADQELNFSTTSYLYLNRAPEDYFVVVRGKEYGGNPFNFGVVPNNYASCPYKFSAISPIKADVVFSNYGTDNSTLCYSWNCYFINIGKLPFVELPYKTGVAFTVPSETSFKLHSISVTAIQLWRDYKNYNYEPATYTISVNADSNGLPGDVLEQFKFSNFNGNILFNPVLLTGFSVSRPVLSVGTQYWLTADVSNPNTMLVGWPINNQNSSGFMASVHGNGTWLSYYNPYGELPAFRVMGTPTSGNSDKKIHGLFIGLKDDTKNPNFRGDIAAKQLASTFARYGATVVVITGDYSSGNLTQGFIEKSIKNILDNMKSGETFILYVTTHGSTDVVGAETTASRGDELLALKTSVIGNLLINDNELTSLLKPYSGINKMVLIDSCHSGGFWGNNNSQDSGDLEKISRTAMVASASETGDSNYDKDGLPLITVALTRGFHRSGGYLLMDTNHDNILSISEIGKWVQNAEEKQNYTDTVVFNMGFGDPVLFTEDMWIPEYFVTADFDGDIEIKSLQASPVALVTIDSSDGATLMECTNSGFMDIVFDGSASIDPEDDLLTYKWEGSFGVLHGEKVTVTLPVGEHTTILTVNDGNGGTDSATVRVVVEPCRLNCDINEDGKHDGRDVAELQTGCKADIASWLCDVNGDNQYDGRDVAEYQKQCKVKK